MGQQDSASLPQCETLVGCWHALGPLELRRLLIEGTTLVVSGPVQELQVMTAVALPVTSPQDDADLLNKIPDLCTPLVCMCVDGAPEPDLADRLRQLGYRYVFIPESHWAGRVAIGSL